MIRVRDAAPDDAPLVWRAEVARCVRQASTCKEMQCIFVTDPNSAPIERPYCECMVKCVEPGLAQ